MTRARPSWPAARLLEFVASEHEALAGDLSEELRAGRSAMWFWRQLVRAVALTAWTKRRPAGMVHLPVETSQYERATRTFGLLDPAPMQLSGKRLRGAGGAGLLGTILLITLVMPQAWFLVLFGLAGGIVVGILRIRQRRGDGLSGPPDVAPIALFGRNQSRGDRARPGANGRSSLLVRVAGM